MEPLDYITIGSAVLNFLLGGTTVWSIIQWLSEKRLRKIEEKSKASCLSAFLLKISSICSLYRA